MKNIVALWNSNSENDWKKALENYWTYVKPQNLSLERELNNLQLKQIIQLDTIGWYNFLLEKYFRWKYTAPNRYATTTKYLKKYKESGKLDKLFIIKERLLNLDLSDIKNSLLTANKINGLGIAGASGLLSLMYPHIFSTVGQFAVKALCKISELPEIELLEQMNPEGLKLKDGVLLIKLMQRKAQENNNIFNTNFWTPRKIDMVLWGVRE